VVLSPEDLSDTDDKILEQLQEGRVTPQYLANQLDISRPYASDKLRRFVEHGHIERLASGLYELEDDPRN
jgi:predicted HTH transcriptional regulator